MHHLENVSMHHSFSNLRILRVFGCKELTYLFTVAMVSGLKKLEQLEISNCPVLRTLVGEDCGVGVIIFPYLKYMYLEELPNMVSLSVTMIELPEMVELKLGTLPNFTSIYPDNSNPCVTQALLSKKVVIPKLEKLYIYDMENLKQIWPSQMSTTEKNNVTMLRMINLCMCDSLINIFPNNPLPMLNNLEEFEVSNCGSIEVIFNIDFEHVSEMEGYVSRLRSVRVECLVKLKELWRMRGVNNSTILINGFQAVQSIFISDCKRFESTFTPVTTNFDLSALTDYIVEGVNVISEVDDNISNVTYLSYLLPTYHHLQHLRLSSVERVAGVLFDVDGQSSKQLATIQPPLLLPYLQSIYLYNLKEMSHVWKCSWNKFLIRQDSPLQFPFQNLTNISLLDCNKIKYLFSPLMEKYLSNLKSVYIRDCDGMEEVISRRDDENTTSAFSYQDTTFFPYLDTLQLVSLPSLKSVDDGQAQWSSKWCLLVIVPIPHEDIHNKVCCIVNSNSMVCSRTNEQASGTLEIMSCETMMEVFESESINHVDGGTCSVAGPTLASPPLRNVTIVVVPQLSNLTSVSISDCDCLPHLFPFDTLESLKQLKQLMVSGCKAMQVIVKEENETSSKVVVVVFPRLETLELDHLPNLKGFFLGVNEFQWPSLNDLYINHCPQLMMFTYGQSTTPKLKYIHTSFGKYSLECGLNLHGTISQMTIPTSSDFHSLVELSINNRNVKKIIPSDALQQLQKLEHIHLVECRLVNEVFEVVASEETNNGRFSASQTVVQIPNLTQVKLERLKNVKYLWKRNHWMVLQFPNLTTLSIDACFRMGHVFTCSMVGSLVQLQDLQIRFCRNIEVIVNKEEDEECDAKVNEIMLPRLNTLKLVGLQSFKGFCLGNTAFSLPALDTLEINRCPSITYFTKGHVSTPKLKVIHTNFMICYVKTDINSFIKTKQEEVPMYIYSFL
ncbi:putative leucine-rich repeat domain superfamily [Helianthus annuus]|nr:putative leucine-rich repeat domain superfamily [Helianthus annuus]